MHQLCWGTNYGGCHPRRAEVHPWTETTVFVQLYPLIEKNQQRKIQIVRINDVWSVLNIIVFNNHEPGNMKSETNKLFLRVFIKYYKLLFLYAIFWLLLHVLNTPIPPKSKSVTQCHHFKLSCTKTQYKVAKLLRKTTLLPCVTLG